MYRIDHISIDGRFALPESDERVPLFKPATEERIGTVRLANARDVKRAVETAQRAFRTAKEPVSPEPLDG